MRAGATVYIPRNVTVAACNGEMFAIEPELELEDYGIILRGSEDAASVFRDWLVEAHGGRVPVENIFDRWPNSPPKMRRFYAYIAGEFETLNGFVADMTP